MTIAHITVIRYDSSSGEEVEVELKIKGNVEPFIDACRNGHPDNWTPAEGGFAEIENVTAVNINQAKIVGDLTDKEREEAEQALQEAFVDADDASWEAALEAKYEMEFEEG